MPSFDKTRALADIDRVVAHQASGSGTPAVSERLMLAIACIDRWTPPGSTYREIARKFADDDRHVSKQSASVDGALLALRADVAAGSLDSFASLINAELFSSLIDQAEHLLTESHRLPSAVLVGAALEEHIKKLAAKNGLPLVTTNGEPVKTSNLNDQLGKRNAYSKADQDLVAGWLKLRNEAAHNKPEFAQRTDADVRLMAQGVRLFISKT